MSLPKRAVRSGVKFALTKLERAAPAMGLRLLIYHRLGGSSPDEGQTTREQFVRHLDILSDHRVLGLDAALDELDAGDDSSKVVLTFDDGFADIYEHAWPVLRGRHLPFVVYLASGYAGTVMRWPGSTARSSGVGLSWKQLAEMVSSGLCTVGNHTHAHVQPKDLTVEEIDRCSEAIQHYLGVSPRHFAYPWGVRVPAVEPAVRTRFRSAVTSELGINHPGDDPMRLRRIAVRQTDPLPFFEAKLTGSLRAERAYDRIVSGAKRVGLRA